MSGRKGLGNNPLCSNISGRAARRRYEQGKGQHSFPPAGVQRHLTVKHHKGVHNAR
jgi:hypothetical protein